MGNDQSSQGRLNKGLQVLRPGPSHSKIQSHLQMAKKSRILQLKDCGIKNIPVDVDNVAELLRSLDLSNNKIVEIPTRIDKFTALKQLTLRANRLAQLPDEIGSLKTLESIDVGSNQLTSLPDSISALSQLKTLIVSGNRLATFPESTTLLLNIELLDVSSNLLESLPDSVKSLKVVELNLNQNRLTSLNDNLVYCPRLKVFRVEENCLEKTAFSADFLKNSQTSLIAYAGNLFQDSDFQKLDGYEQYQDRFTATKRKGL